MYNEYNIKEKRLQITALSEEEHARLREKTLSDVTVVPVCLGRTVGCHLASWSNGTTGRAHFCDGNGLDVDYYVLYSDSDTDELVRAHAAGKCNHTHLDIARRNIDGKNKRERTKDMKAAFRELKELILLVGNKIEQFYTIWRISMRPSDKEFYDLFMDSKTEFTESNRDKALMECVVMLNSQEYRDTIPRLPDETEYAWDKRFRQQAVLHLKALQQLATGSYAEFQMDANDYEKLIVATEASITQLKNQRLLNNCFLDFNSESALALFIERAGYGHCMTDDIKRKWLGE